MKTFLAPDQAAGPPRRAGGGWPARWALAMLAALLVWVLACPPVLAADPAPSAEVRVAVLRDLPPLYSLDPQGHPEGFAVEVWEATAQLAGLASRYQVYGTWDEALDALAKGQADVIPNLGVTQSRDRALDFTMPVEVFNVVLFVRTTTHDLASLGDLAGRKVGCLTGSAAKEYLETQPGPPQVVSFPKASEGLFQLLSGGVDAFAFPEHVGWDLARRAGVEDRIKVVGTPLMEIKRAMALPAGHSQLLERLNAALGQYLFSQGYKDTFTRWFGRPPGFWTPMKVFLAMAALLVACLTVVGLWRYRSVLVTNRRLMQAMKLRQQAEASRAQSEQRFWQTIENSPLPMAVLDLQGKVLLLNDKATQTFGYTQEDVPTLEHWWDKAHPQEDQRKRYREQWRQQMEKADSQGTDIPPAEYEVTCKDGSVRYVEVMGRNLDQKLLVVCRDISDSLKAQEALAESEARFRRLYEEAPLPYQSLDAEGIILDVNRRWLELMGYAKDEVMGRWFGSFLAPESHGYLVDGLPCLKENGQISEVPLSLTRRDGQIIQVSLNGTISRDEAGNFLRTHCIFQDVTERWRAERALRDSEERFRQLAENIDIVFWVEEPASQRLLYVNSAYEHIWGRPVQSLYDDRLSWLEAVPMDQRPQLLESLRGEPVLGPSGFPGAEFQIQRPDGSFRWVVARSFPIRDEEGNVYRRAGIAADITERRRAEQSLRQSEEKFRLAFYTSPDAVVITSLRDSRVLDVNQGFSQITGYQREEVLGKTAKELGLWYNADDRQLLLDGLYSQGQITQMEATMRMKDGSLVACLVSAGLLVLDNQPCILSVTKVIEDLKRVEEALRQSQAKLAHASALAHLGQWEWYPQSGEMFWSEEIFRILGHEPHAVTASLDTLRRALSPGDREAFEEALRACLEEARPLSGEFSLERPGGHLGHVYLVGEVTQDKSGRPQRLAGALQDITQLRRAEQALAESEEKFAKAFRASPTWVTINTVAEGRFLEVSDAFCQMTGFSRQEALGRTGYEMNMWGSPADERQAGVDIFLGQGSLRNHETRMRFKDGQLHEVLWSADPFSFLGQDCMINVVLDVTEKKRLEAERQLLEGQLRQAQKMEAVGTMAGGIAHDFNNILGAVMGFAEIAQDVARDGQDNSQELGQILEAAQRASLLVRQLLTFSRKVQSDRRSLDLNELVSRVQVIMESTLPKMVRVETSLGPGLPPVRADANQLEQVLLNLANNARDAMPEGGTLSIHTSGLEVSPPASGGPAPAEAGHYVALTVRDSGQGMDAQVLEHIYDPFFTTKEPGKGTGLGLSSVYGIVKNHGGQIFCDSTPGQGTTFTIWLPAAQEEQAPAPAPISTERPKGGNETLLLVDDEKALRDLGMRNLSRMGYRVLAAASGEEALDIYQERRGIDLVILDLNMPGMGGHRCLRQLLEINPDAKVLIASGYSAEGMAKETLAAGAVGFVAKPYRGSELLATVRRALDQPPPAAGQGLRA